MNDATTMQAPQVSSFVLIRTLGLIALVSGLLVVLVFEWTKPAIEQNKREMIERAVFQVVPGATQRRDFVVTANGIARTGDGITVYAAYDDDNKLRGIAAEAAAQGYQDVIRLLYGYNPECQCITGIRVLKLSETPGLGDKIITDADFVANFNALDASVNASMSALANAIVTVKHGRKQNPWEIDAISGATISSKAVGKALNDSAQQLLPLLVPHIKELTVAGDGA
ncbi:RnfABCDGE type electron transport complex subunit G [Sedimenticola sp.]|uniref:RnfABCDGE type electron transport complex subunit G n=1 Tax=Sedimenticola sp. TaxID=1940285 RepID=UPI003D0ABF81